MVYKLPIFHKRPFPHIAPPHRSRQRLTDDEGRPKTDAISQRTAPTISTLPDNVQQKISFYDSCVSRLPFSEFVTLSEAKGLARHHGIAHKEHENPPSRSRH